MSTRHQGKYSPPSHLLLKKSRNWIVNRRLNPRTSKYATPWSISNPYNKLKKSLGRILKSISLSATNSTSQTKVVRTKSKGEMEDLVIWKARRTKLNIAHWDYFRV